VKRKCKQQFEPELPDLTKSQCRWEQFNATWADVPADVERQRRALAQRLVEGRLPPDYLKGCSTHGAVFNPD
jgi:acid phosphatase class B